MTTTRLVDETREGRLRNLSRAVGNGLNEEIKRNKSALTKSLLAYNSRTNSFYF